LAIRKALHPLEIALIQPLAVGLPLQEDFDAGDCHLDVFLLVGVGCMVLTKSVKNLSQFSLISSLFVVGSPCLVKIALSAHFHFGFIDRESLSTDNLSKFLYHEPSCVLHSFHQVALFAPSSHKAGVGSSL
jgi:hypothetical protein